MISVLPQGRRVDVSLRWDSEQVFLALSAESKLLLVAFSTSMGRSGLHLSNVCHHSRDAELLLICYFLGKGRSSGFHLAFPTLIARTTQVRKPMWGFCQQLSMSVPITHSGAGEIATGWA